MGFNLRNYSVSNPEDCTNAAGETLEFRVLNKTDKNQDPVCHADVHICCPTTDVQIIYHDGMTVAECPQDSLYYHPNTHKCYPTPPYQ